MRPNSIFFLSYHKFYSWKFIFHLLKVFCCRKPCRTFGSFKEESNLNKSYSFLKTLILTHIITVWRFYFLSLYIPHPQLCKLTMWPKLTLSLHSTILPALVYLYMDFWKLTPIIFIIMAQVPQPAIFPYKSTAQSLKKKNQNIFISFWKLKLYYVPNTKKLK